MQWWGNGLEIQVHLQLSMTGGFNPCYTTPTYWCGNGRGEEVRKRKTFPVEIHELLFLVPRICGRLTGRVPECTPDSQAIKDPCCAIYHWLCGLGFTSSMVFMFASITLLSSIWTPITYSTWTIKLIYLSNIPNPMVYIYSIRGSRPGLAMAKFQKESTNLPGS